ncbi:hypothetical protein KABACHOK_04010 [Brevundimonas phage vB_BpoS-Kabachok]|uniref:DUF2460 domain-containing protein n=1 Tax=Brevundimonas phage vB_BpoS-Kabachok TaxID=2948600 RepID=A0A9E7MPX6_9CAUD|nr:hypothetical protein KABACHOK_04010 [Brevundimonas phage vB_BpoS-Kabachok]
MSDFHDILFPPDISYGSSGGPKFKTSVWEADSGFEARVDHWPETRAEYDVSHGVKSQAQAEALTTFFMNRCGRAYGFRFKDFNDYRLENVTLGQGDYATHVYQLHKEYRNTSATGQEFLTTRRIEKVEWNSEKGVQIDGSTLTKSISASRNYKLDYNTGKLTLNTPMWGGRYAATTPYQRVTFLPPFDPGALLGNSYASGSVTRPVLFYASESGHAFVRGWAGTGLGYFVLRRFHLPTAKEDAQATHLTMQVPGGEAFDHIVGVSPAGMVYLTMANTLVKVDGRTMQYVAKGPPATIWNPAIQEPIVPGCVSSNEQYLLNGDSFGYVRIYSTETLTMVADLGRFGGSLISQRYRGACPYKLNGFAFVHFLPDSSPGHGCALSIWFGGTMWTAIEWGASTARPDAVFYDKKTEGLLIFWNGEEGINNSSYSYDYWCGLFLPEEGKWAWTRRMPPSLTPFHALTNGQTVLNGELCWVRGTGTPFGDRMWSINTESGVLVSRRTPESGGEYQVYDPDRKYVGAFGGIAVIDPSSVYSTDFDGVAFTPPEVLTMDSAEFHIGVRFDTDHLNMKHDFWTYRSWDSIPLVEVRDWSELELD